MSFSIVLQRNDSPANKVGKKLTEAYTATGYLRDVSSIIDPVVVIESELPETTVSQVNYATIDAFNRKYFITNIVSINRKLWEIHMHVDVLESYKAQLIVQNAIIARSASKYNLYLDDGWFLAYQNPIVQTRLFSTEGPFEQQEFVLVVAGNGPTT